MDEKKITIANVETTPSKHESHQNYEYFKHLIVPKEATNQCTVAIMEIPPQKLSYPYHYHMGITEIFYIISGNGRLETPDGERPVTKGDVIVFPPGKHGAHRIMNVSDSEMLVYLDCDTTSMSDVAFYPHTGKIGTLVVGEPAFFEIKDKVDYYKGE